MDNRKIESLDGVWPLERFVLQKEAEASIKYGFIGLGQGGSKIVDAFAAVRSNKDGEPVYTCMIVNSNLGDMTSLKNIPPHMQFGLKGYEKGVGKNPEIGLEAFMKNGAEIFEAVNQYMSHCDMIYVCASFGGGTGTGSINALVDAIADYMGKPVAAITSLPRPDEVESLNAYNASAELVPKLTDIRDDGQGGTYRGLDNIVILDNDKIVKEHLAEPEVQNITWDYYSNYKVASIMHEWNVLTSLGSAITLDAADLTNHILRTGGILTFAKKKIKLNEIKSTEDLIMQIISTYKGKNVLANGFDYEKDLRSMGLVVVMPKNRAGMINQDTLEMIRSKMNVELPHVNFYPGFASHNSENTAIVYTIASMAGLPERARNLRNEAEELMRIRIEKEKAASGFNMGEKLSTKPAAVTPTRRGSGNPFGGQNQVAASSQPPIKKNPFLS